MSFMPDQYFVQTLDSFSEKYLNNPVDKTQISGWSEDFDDSDARKCLLSAGCSRIKKFLVESDLFYTSSQRSRQLTKGQLINKTSSLGPYNPKLTEKGKPQILNKRFSSKGPKNSFQISAVPLLKIRAETKKQQSYGGERKSIKLFEYYDKNFLIVQKSPPIVSGYSVTFYHK